MIIAEVKPNGGFTPEQVRDQYNLADTILNRSGVYYVAMRIINAEFEMVTNE